MLELRGTIQWKHFKDKWPNIFIENVQEVAGRDGAELQTVRTLVA